MIILDTNVVSEALKPGSDDTVVEWLDKQAPESLYLTATSLSELLLGLAIMPEGKRKASISNGLFTLVTKLFHSRILSFDYEAAAAYSVLVSSARAAGKSISMADGQIAAVASVHGFSVATRDVKPFETLGIRVINPWARRDSRK